MVEDTRLEADTRPTTAARGLAGGVLMGLANLVPGISGGTMLLVVGIYPQFINGVAEVSTLRFRRASLMLLGSVLVGAAAVILGLAGPVGDLVVHQRWIMYSLFIGLTLGGVPVLWELLERLDVQAIVAALAGFGVMAVLAFVEPGETNGSAEGHPYVLLFVAGVAGASAMILPGVSGAYLLLVLGQYVRILAAIEEFTAALREGDLTRAFATAHVGVPVALGVVAGVTGVSNLARWLLARYERATLGFLLGLLLGAVLGLWPYREPVDPLAENVAEQTRLFAPTAVQIGAGVALVAVGFGISWGVSHLGRTRKEQ
jgi:putative membrane protein